MSRLLDMVKNFQYSQGGPIVAFQVENEYGSYNKDPKYLPWVKNIYEKSNIVELLYTSGMDHFLGTIKNIAELVLHTLAGSLCGDQ